MLRREFSEFSGAILRGLNIEDIASMVGMQHVSSIVADLDKFIWQVGVSGQVADIGRLVLGGR